MASMTKPITTAAAMMLVEQGVIKLNDPIAQLLPELKDLKVEVSKPNADGILLCRRHAVQAAEGSL
jgi:CubicO group peptidase (beta-lactamase class C family)